MGEFPIFDEKIAENMKKASAACYKNGKDLLEEANILYEARHYARTISLAILAEEEFSKAMILQLCAINGRWDRELLEGLKIHENKHALSGAMSSFMVAFVRHLSRSKYSLFQQRFNIALEVEDKVNSAKKEFIKKQLKDRRKQFAQFVSIGKTGLPCKTPSEFKQSDAECEVDNSFIFMAYLEALYGIRKDDDPLFRGCSSIRYSHGVTTLLHQSGVTVYMKPFAWVDSGCDSDEVIMNPLFTLRELKSFDPKEIDDKQKVSLAKIYKAYNFPGQIRSEMQKLGLRGTGYLDEVEQLIKRYAE